MSAAVACAGRAQSAEQARRQFADATRAARVVARRFALRPDEADDLAQEVALRCWQEQPRNAFAFAYKAAVRVMLTRRREKATERRQLRRHWLGEGPYRKRRPRGDVLERGPLSSKYLRCRPTTVPKMHEIESIEWAIDNKLTLSHLFQGDSEIGASSLLEARK